MRRIVVAFCLTFLPLFSATFAHAQDGWCWEFYYPGRPGEQPCECLIHYAYPGMCSCWTEYGECFHGPGVCAPPYSTCQTGTAPTKAQLATIQKAVAAHKSIMTVFTRKACAEGELGKAWVKEASAQGKAIRFVVMPENLSKEQVQAYNVKLKAIQKALRKQEEAADQITLPLDNQ
jgi:hypothetical protein